MPIITAVEAFSRKYFGGNPPPFTAWRNRLFLKLEPERMVSHRMPLDDAAQAYQLFDQRIATKAVLYP